MIGCAMSHLKVWRHITDLVAQRSDPTTARPVSPYDMFLILEDDVRLSDDFGARWPAVREAAIASTALCTSTSKSWSFLVWIHVFSDHSSSCRKD